MPFVISGDAKIYYEVKGSGPPLVLVEGLGYASWMWFFQVEDLSRDHKLVIFDNRGAGKSDKPNYPYTMEMFAEDLRTIIREVLLDSPAHILGVSMGGMIAQEFALKYPSLVKSLILVSTHHGGRDIDPTPPETLQAMFGEPPPHIKSERGLYRYKMSFALSREWINSNREVLERIIDLRLREPQPQEAYINQARAVIGFDVSKRLHEITAPVLIVHGDQDRVVPVGNAYKLHERIRNSSLAIFRGAGHLVIMERPADFNNLVRVFVREVEGGSYTPRREPVFL
ncbi:MAG: alpha/beta hydrolase [Desulfurococcales archaeon]|nr:alpha/beta hydrolase [Desulfurococcales archaeon]